MKVDHVLPERSSLTLGRRITRRLSLVARVPNLIPVKWRAEALDVAEIGGNMRLWSQQLRRARPVTINVILPNGVERTVSLSYSFATFTCFISCLFLSLFLFYSFIYLLIFFNTASDLIFFLEKIFIIIWIFVLVCSSHDWWFNWFFVFLRFRFWDGSFRFISRFPPNPARKIKNKNGLYLSSFFLPISSGCLWSVLRTADRPFFHRISGSESGRLRPNFGAGKKVIKSIFRLESFPSQLHRFIGYIWRLIDLICSQCLIWEPISSFDFDLLFLV